MDGLEVARGYVRIAKGTIRRIRGLAEPLSGSQLLTLPSWCRETPIP